MAGILQYTSFLESVRPQVEEIMGLSLGSQLPSIDTADRNWPNINLVASYSPQIDRITVYLDHFEKKSMRVQKDILAHELAHAIQFRNFPHVREFFLYVPDFASATSATYRAKNALEILLEGDACQLEDRLHNPLSSSLRLLSRKAVLKMGMETYLEKKYFIGATVISSLQKKLGRDAVNSLYSLPIPELTNAVVALVKQQFPRYSL